MGLKDEFISNLLKAYFKALEAEKLEIYLDSPNELIVETNNYRLKVSFELDEK